MPETPSAPTIGDYPSLPDGPPDPTPMLRAEAIAAATEAMAADHEARRRQQIASDHPDVEVVSTGEQADGQPLTQSMGAFVAEAVDEAARLAARARRKAAWCTLDDDDRDLLAARRRWLTDRCASLELEHAAHAAHRAERLAALAVTGPDAPTDDERRALEARVAEHHRDMTLLADLWAHARHALDELPGAPDDPPPGPM